MWSIRSHSSRDMNSGPCVPVSLCYTAAWWMKSAQKRERYSGDIYGHLHYLEASYGLEDKDDFRKQFPSLNDQNWWISWPTCASKGDGIWLSVVHPLHAVLYNFSVSEQLFCTKSFEPTLKKPLHVLSFKFSFPFPCVPKDTNGCSVTECLYFLLSTMGLCITVSNFSPDCAISLGAV